LLLARAAVRIDSEYHWRWWVTFVIKLNGRKSSAVILGYRMLSEAASVFFNQYE
jgi:hypothetical protein